MTSLRTEIRIHPAETELAGFLDGSLSPDDRKRLEAHISSCDECLCAIVSAKESVDSFRGTDKSGKERNNPMKKINAYLILAALAFTLSFAMPQYFIQLLVATIILAVKWIVDAKTTRMLVMIYEAWKKGGEKEASRILKELDIKPKNRL